MEVEVPWIDIVMWTIFCVVPYFFALIFIICFYVVGKDKEKLAYERFSQLYYIYMWIYIIALILMATVTEVGNVFEDITGLKYFFYIGIAINYLIVLFESFNSSDSMSTNYVLDAGQTEEFLKILRETSAVITFHGRCYHIERGPIQTTSDFKIFNVT